MRDGVSCRAIWSGGCRSTVHRCDRDVYGDVYGYLYGDVGGDVGHDAPRDVNARDVYGEGRIWIVDKCSVESVGC